MYTNNFMILLLLRNLHTQYNICQIPAAKYPKAVIKRREISHK